MTVDGAAAGPAFAEAVAQLARELATPLGLDSALVDAASHGSRPRAGAGDDPREVARVTTDALAEAACLLGDHAAEARIRRWRLDEEVDSDPAPRAGAWWAWLSALGHQVDRAATADRPPMLDSLRLGALEAAADAAAGLDLDEPTSEAAVRRLLDPIGRLLAGLEAELGMEPSAPAADLVRRDRVRATRTAPSPTFAARHAEDLAALRSLEARKWFADRFVERHGVDPPEGWWVEREVAAGAGSGGITPEAAELFEPEDQLDFLSETEARFRAECGLPAIGEGWVSAASLARYVADALPGRELIREARLPWLGAQRLDLFIPSLQLAIEYQGEQHYLALEHWGGEAGLAARRELDERKRDACVRAGVVLLEWRYDEPISAARVHRRLVDAGVPGLPEPDAGSDA